MTLVGTRQCLPVELMTAEDDGLHWSSDPTFAHAPVGGLP